MKEVGTHIPISPIRPMLTKPDEELKGPSTPTDTVAPTEANMEALKSLPDGMGTSLCEKTRTQILYTVWPE